VKLSMGEHSELTFASVDLDEICDSDLGDIWAQWLKFERQHGTEATRQEVINWCMAAEPHHSPVWEFFAKDDKNVGKGTKEILEIVVIIQ